MWQGGPAPRPGSSAHKPSALRASHSRRRWGGAGALHGVAGHPLRLAGRVLPPAQAGSKCGRGLGAGGLRRRSSSCTELHAQPGAAGAVPTHWPSIVQVAGPSAPHSGPISTLLSSLCPTSKVMVGCRESGGGQLRAGIVSTGRWASGTSAAAGRAAARPAAASCQPPNTPWQRTGCRLGCRRRP